MEYLAITITESTTAEGSALEGRYSKRSLEGVSLSEFLAADLMARLGENKLPALQEAFMTLAMRKNGAAAASAAEAIRSLMVPTHGRYASHFSLDDAGFKKLSRQQQGRFLDWLLSVYWKLPLYTLHRGHATFPRNGEVIYAQPLKPFIQWAQEYVVEIWNATDDSVGRKAFKFLCALVDSAQFIRRAPQMLEGSFVLRDKAQFAIPSEDVNFIIQKMRESCRNGGPKSSCWYGLSVCKMPGHGRCGNCSATPT